MTDQWMLDRVRQMRPDEAELFIAVWDAWSRRLWAWDVLVALHTAGRLHMNRAFSLMEKWTDQGLWDYGVSVRTGWFTADGDRLVKMIATGDVQ